MRHAKAFLPSDMLLHGYAKTLALEQAGVACLPTCYRVQRHSTTLQIYTSKTQQKTTQEVSTPATFAEKKRIVPPPKQNLLENFWPQRQTFQAGGRFSARTVSEYCSACVSCVGLSIQQATEPYSDNLLDRTRNPSKPYSDKEIPFRRALGGVALLVLEEGKRPPPSHFQLY